VACCAALTLIFAWVYRAFGWLRPGRDEAFGPAASWPPVERTAAVDIARSPQEVIARACIVVGLAWFIAGVLAMHVFGVIDPIRSLPADVVFHASGWWLATVGIALRFLPRHALRRAA